MRESTGLSFQQLSLFGLIAGVFNLSPIRLHMHLSDLRLGILACRDPANFDEDESANLLDRA